MNQKCEEREEACRHINQIAEEYKASPRIKESLSGALWVVERSFARTGHLLLEFMQNAEDAEANKLKITLDQTSGGLYELVICNDGNRLSKDDVDAICSIGRSRKDPRVYLGYLGVGFKSSFLVSDNIRVYSWPYSFKFDKSWWPDPERTPWQIAPIWLEDYPDGLREWKTTFILTIRPSEIKPIVNEMETLTSGILLFTHNLKEIILKWGYQSRSFSKSESVIREDNGHQLLRVDVEEARNYKLERASWIVFRSIIDVPPDISQDPLTKEWKRDAVKKREIGVAFRLDESGDLSPAHGALKFGLFSYLPLREEVYGLQFIIHGDFLTGPGRETIHREATWNKWLLEKIKKFIIDYVIPEFKQNPTWKFSYTCVLHGNAPHIIDEYLAKPLREEIINGMHILDLNEEFVGIKDVIVVSEDVMDLLDSDFIQKLSGKHMLNLKSKLCESITKQLEYEQKGFFSVVDLAKKHGDHYHLREIFGDSWITCLRKLLEALADEWFGLPEDERKNSSCVYKYKQSIRVLSTRGESCYPHEIMLATDELERQAEEKLPGAFRFLHPELRTVKIMKFLEDIGAKWLRREDIEREYQNSRVPELIKELWDASTSDDRRVEIVKELFKVWSDGFIQLEKLKDIPVRTKAGKWVRPEAVAFSNEYQPEYRLEELISRGFLDVELEFLDPVFIKDAALDEISKWRNFFEGIGLGKELKQKLDNFAERVGILLSLRYEKERGFKAEELTESEAKGEGYDIRSVMPDGSIKCIEVKSTRGEERNLNFTKPQYRRLMNESERYFVYVVTDALSHPELRVLSGVKLRELLVNLSAEVTLRYSDWKDIEPEATWRPTE
jgi:hypothetical protein